MASVSILSRYPREHAHMPWGTAGAILLHLFIAGIVLLLAWIFGVKSIEQLMRESGALAIQPPPDQPVEIEMKDELPPPPPVENPEFVRQILQPKPVPPPPVVKKVPPPKPHPVVHAEPAMVSQLVVGSMQFPQPGYPYQALLHREQGTVVVSIRFDGAGRPDDVTVTSSCGHPDLDASTCSFIRAHWKDPDFAGRAASVPIQYTF